MEERKRYLFRVSHPVHGEIEVEASERYFAVTAAAHEWGLRWSTIARDCKVEQLGDTPIKKQKKGGGKVAKADKKRQRSHR